MESHESDPHVSVGFHRALLVMLLIAAAGGWVLARSEPVQGLMLTFSAMVLGASFWGRRFAVPAGVVMLAMAVPDWFEALGTALVVMLVGERTNLLRSRVGRFAERSFTDRLTGLFNYDFLQAQVRYEIDRLRRYGGSCSLIVMDLDNFKRFNDTFGHQAGNLALQAVADTIRRHKRESDFAARFGGEEMVVLVPGEADDAMRLAERIRSAVELIEMPQVGPGGRLGVSLGIATFPEQAANAAELFERADQALYVAKETGKNRTIVYPNSLVRPRQPGDVVDATGRLVVGEAPTPPVDSAGLHATQHDQRHTPTQAPPR